MVSSMYTTARNWTLMRFTAAESLAHLVSAVARWAIVNMPCAMIPGNPTLRAKLPSWCRGFWSPEASAYAFTSSRFTTFECTGISSPTFRSSNRTLMTPSPAR